VTAYYNEIDPYAAQWLRALIAAGHIADGVVDERSIEDVHPPTSGASRNATSSPASGSGPTPFAAPDGPTTDLFGPVPVRANLSARQAKALGFADERHLWPAWHTSSASAALCASLESRLRAATASLGSTLFTLTWKMRVTPVGAFDLCAAGVGAPHIRQRLFFVADDHGAGRSKLGRGRVLHGERAPQRDDADRCGADGLMADSHGRHAGAERQQRRGEHRLQPARRRSVLLGDAGDEGLAQRIGFHGVPGGASGADAGEAAFGAGFHAGELAHAGQVKRGRWPHEPQPGCADSRERDEAAIHDQRRSGARFWDACDWIECRDGKRRPVEPGTFPLAHGAPARVGRLRAYGNAIVAPLAAEFVRATL
jgi:DNA (cytosine-5)-methyltransferase 1